MLNLHIPTEETSYTPLSEHDRRWLVRLCAFLSGSPEAAEDLAQEALLEAWRHQDSLRDPEKRSAWLAGIARNVCKRRRRAQAQNRAHAEDGDEARVTQVAALPDETDLAVELERHELVTLLDRAMALLEPEVRDVLVSRFVHESPHAEIARRLGLTEGTVKVRVHRGKLRLRRLLETQFADELEGYGFEWERGGWRDTRVWCSRCGTHRLQMRIVREPTVAMFRCPACHPDRTVTSSEFPLENPRLAALVGGLTRPATILRKGSDWFHHYYLEVAGDGHVPCMRCGIPVPVESYRREGRLLVSGGTDGIYSWCRACGEAGCVSREGLVASLPAARAFEREQGRVRIYQSRHVHTGSRPAVVTTVESMTRSDQLNVLTDAQTCRIIEVHRGSALPATV